MCTEVFRFPTFFFAVIFYKIFYHKAILLKQTKVILSDKNNYCKFSKGN